MEAEVGVMLSQTKGCWVLPEAGRGKERFTLTDFGASVEQMWPFQYLDF